MKPSPEADRATLLRRVSLDLIGLPPTPEEVDAFLADRSPDAYEKQVDRLLASPHYGERWARRWLDLARYADTNGYEKDRPRSIWPYRDWVIKALNADLPFDRFTIEQLAGDMLPGAALAQKVATGFHRNTMLNEEGGIDPLEFRFYAMTDRVATTGDGLARPDARLRPVPHAQVRPDPASRLLPVHGAPEQRRRAGDARSPPPRSPAPPRARSSRIAALEADLPESVSARGQGRTTSDRADARRDAGRSNLERTVSASGSSARRPHAVRWTVLEPMQATSNLPRLTIEPDGSIFASGDQTKRDVYTVRSRTGLERDHGDPPRGAARRPAAQPRAGPRLLRGAVRRLLPERDPASTAGGKPRAAQGGDGEQPEGREATPRPRSTATRRPAGRSTAARAASTSAVFRLAAPLAERRRARRSRCSSSAITPPGSADSGSRRRPTRGRSQRERDPGRARAICC